MSSLGTLAVQLEVEAMMFNRQMEAAKEKFDDLSEASKTFAMASAAAFAGLAGTIGASIAAISSQREAELQLANAFKASGEAVPIDRIVELAGALQQVTLFEDDATIGAASLLARFGATESQIVSLIPRVQDMAQALGVDLNSAAMVVGKALSGETGTLSRYGIVLDEATKAMIEHGDTAARAAAVMDLLDGKFKGAAEAASQTATGGIVILKNAVGDLFEELGKLFEGPIGVGVKALTNFIQTITQGIASMSDGWKSFLGIATLVVTALAGVGAVLGTIGAVLPFIATGFALAFGPVGIIVGAVAIALAAVGFSLADVNAELASMEKYRNVFDDPDKTLNKRVRAEMEAEEERNRNGGTVDLTAGTKYRTEMDKQAAKAADKLAKAMEKAAEEAKKEAAAMDTWDTDYIAGATDQVGKTIKEFGDRLQTLTEHVQDGIDDMAKSNQDRRDKLKEGGGPASLDEAVHQKISSFANTMDSGSGELAGAIDAGISVLYSALAQGGDNISAAMEGAAQGFQAGGIWGAIIGAIIGLLSTLDGFKEILAVLDAGLGRAVAGFDPVMQSLSDFVQEFSAFMDIMSQMGRQMHFVGPIMELISYLLYQLGEGFRKLTNGLADIYNWVLDMVASLLDWLGLDDWADDVRDSKLDVEESRDAFQEAARSVYDEKEAVDETADSLGDFNDKMRDANEELTNIPAGLKINRERFEAINPDMVAGSDFSAEVGGTTVEQLNIYAWDQAAAFREFDRMSKAKRWRQGGSSQANGGSFSTPNNGAG